MRLPLAAVLAATALLGGVAGCGVVGRVKQAADNISSVGDLAGKLGNNEKLTYTAEYRLSDGSTTTVVQRPPDAAFIGRTGRFVVTPDALLMCASDRTCQRSANATGQLDVSNAGMIPSVAGAGFISAPVALAMLTAAPLAPGAKVDQSTRRIAGQHSTCLKVTGIRTDHNSEVRGFTACVTDSGLLSSFTGDTGDTGDTGGGKASIEMTRYSAAADPQSFAVPTGYRVVDVDQLRAGG